MEYIIIDDIDLKKEILSYKNTWCSRDKCWKMGRMLCRARDENVKICLMRAKDGII
jgi:hypothetical protein